jgi:hypothetical protein
MLKHLKEAMNLPKPSQQTLIEVFSSLRAEIGKVVSIKPPLWVYGNKLNVVDKKEKIAFLIDVDELYFLKDEFEQYSIVDAWTESATTQTDYCCLIMIYCDGCIVNMRVRKKDVVSI